MGGRGLTEGICHSVYCHPALTSDSHTVQVRDVACRPGALSHFTVRGDLLPLGVIRWEMFGKAVTRGGGGLKPVSVCPPLPFARLPLRARAESQAGGQLPTRTVWSQGAFQLLGCTGLKSHHSGETGVVEHGYRELKQLSFRCTLEDLEQICHQAL